MNLNSSTAHPAATFSDSQVAKLRADTPGVSHHLHFNNAGCSLSPQSVVEQVKDYLDKEAETGGYALAAESAGELEAMYNRLGRLIHAHPDEIAFQGSATLAWRVAFNGIKWKRGDEILTTEYEYGSNLLAFIQAKEQHGVETVVVPASKHPEALLQQLKNAITSRTRMVAISHMPSSAGYVHPAAEIGQITQQHGLLYFLDACQSVGHCPVNVAEIGCDVLSATGRKYLRAPRGTGFLYVNSNVMDQISPIHLDLLSAQQKTADSYEMKPTARRFETFEANIGLQLGLSEATRYLLDLGIGRVWNRIQQVAAALRGGLGDLKGVQVLDEGELLSGIVTFGIANQDLRQVKTLLRQQQINVSVSARESTFHYMHRNEQPAVMRASVHCFNTEMEVETFCTALQSCISGK